jgi:alpha-amylase
MRALRRAPFLLLLSLAAAADADLSKWEGRSIYFVVTDRFARTDERGVAGCAGREWCGGSLAGITSKLGYIQSMGFDAVWITPVVEQVEWRDRWNGTGYHGYWAKDFRKIEPHIGDAASLRALQAECASRGMLLMLDVVANHVGPIHSLQQVAQLGPPVLNRSDLAQFHTLDRRADESLQQYIDAPVEMQQAGSGCWPWYRFGAGCNRTIILDGWFGDLADLNQTVPEVEAYLLDWIGEMVGEYRLDGLRLDTALYVPNWFLEKFQRAAAVYIVGEVTTLNVSLHRSFTPPLTGLLNFPLTSRLPALFSRGGSLTELRDTLQAQRAAGYPAAGTRLANFIDNHDGPRFVLNHSLAQLRSALTFVLLWHGVPVVYYGTEQLAVSNQTDQRTAQWPHYGTTQLGAFLAQLHALRRAHGLAANGSFANSTARVLSATAGELTFERAGLLVTVRNGREVGEPGCIEPRDLPPAWRGVCGRDGPARVAQVLSAAASSVGAAKLAVARPWCDAAARLCLPAAAGGEPSAFALSHGQS